MASMPWFRMYAEFAHDPKVQSMDETFQRRFIMFLCLHCGGQFENLTLDDLSFVLRVNADEVSRTIELFKTKGLLDADGKIRNWNKRQYKSDVSTERVRKHRRVKGETFQKRRVNGDETPSDTDTDTEKKIGQSDFDRFWLTYPKKVKRKTTAEIWNRKRLDSKTGELIADVQRRLESDRRWREGFIPDPTTYLNQERWGDALEIVKRPRVEGL